MILNALVKYVCFLIVVITFIAIDSVHAEEAVMPSATYVGGRYYFKKNGEWILNEEDNKVWKGQDYTAKAFAVNESFKCACPIVIIQPPITVTTDLGSFGTVTDGGGSTTPEPPVETELKSIVFSWRAPENREDGTSLSVDEIDHYELELDGEIIIVHGLSYILENAGPGTYRARVSTVDKDGNVSKYTQYIEVTL